MFGDVACEAVGKERPGLKLAREQIQGKLSLVNVSLVIEGTYFIS